jgi:hypothetical protein
VLSLTRLRTLDLETPPSTGRLLHLSAASGLVRAGEFLYVVADDELHLGVFRSRSNAPGRLIRLFGGELPATPAERKAQKPDLEAIALLPASPDSPHGALLAVPSGSKARRHTGVLLPLDEHGEVCGSLRECDFSGIFSSFQDRIPSLNIEGAFVCGEELCLLQRANQSQRRNAILRYNLDALLDAVRGGIFLEPSDVHEVELGTIDGVALGLTDGASLSDGRFVFSAVAEDTADAYLDGRCVGAALGIASRDGRVHALHELEHPSKIEGVEATEEAGALRLLLVTDADDAATPACLYSAVMPLR